MKANPLRTLQDFGQSVWLDYLRRSMLESEKLHQLIRKDGLRGITSNPAIFEKVIGDGEEYEEAIEQLVSEGHSAKEIYDALTVADTQWAADIFSDVHRETGGEDGCVSLEVDPHVARDTQATLSEARRLWKAVSRPNVLIKVPGTREALPAITQLISEGLNINVTLMFGLPRLGEVIEAYLTGLERRVNMGQPIGSVLSVASFFLSRIDVLVDELLESKLDESKPASNKPEDKKPEGNKLQEHGDSGVADVNLARQLQGQVAIASAKIAYQVWKDAFESPRFRHLAENGARPQRLLWASTSTKNPNYSDVKYVEALIGPRTINTMPEETLNAYRDHGDPALRLEQDVPAAYQVLEQLASLGIDLDQVTSLLTDEGIEKFTKPYDRLFEKLEQRFQIAR